ncbi:autotransporter-associated beta strand repeat-containing protein [Noviherbaspirillum sp.]|uniref:autotransporter-associated beta strand repeat-containing protein n=1 Tax=Noviherbaspirillum sp. TaxID=1926288 RepID=UPI002D4FCFD0|nr:autotransporter-associated beta strand repeat-containing protein [Noviherbaspirillum sp.]HZW20895.1 autotransporter-associated beta strand repeat-containing protein [Noviherbaspirillum sp.]
MNHIYRLVWNKKRKMLVAVSEATSTQGKSAAGETTANRGRRGRKPAETAALPITLAAAAILSIFPQVASAQSSTQFTPVIAQGETLSITDNELNDAAGSIIQDDGTFDISATTAGANIQSLTGSGAVLLGGQTLTLTNTNDLFAGTISGSGGMAIAGGALTLSGSNEYTGATSIGAGTMLSLTGSGGVANSFVIANEGTLDIAGTDAGASIQSLSGSGAVLLGGQTLTLTNAADTFAGIIDGAGGISIVGGTATLAGSHTYTGATSIGPNSTLALSGSGGIAQSWLIANDGAFDISATDAGASIQSLSGSGAVLLGGQTLTLTNAADTFAGAISGSGGVAITGGTATFSGDNTYTGATVISAGTTLGLAGSGGIAQSSLIENSGSFDISATGNGARIKSLSGSGAVLLGEKMLTLSDASDVFAGAISGSGAVAITGGSQTLSGNNTYTGATSIASGATLKLSGSGGIIDSLGLANNGVLSIAATNNGAKLKNLSGSGAVLLGGQTLTLTDASSTFSGGISGSGGLAITGGTATLSGTNNLTGTTTIGTGSTLKLSGNGSIANAGKVSANGAFDIASKSTGTSIKSLSGSGSVILGGQTLTITSANDTFSGTISGSGGVALSGGVQTLAGTNTHTGGTTVNGGTLKIDSDSNLGSGKLTLNGGKLQTASTLSTSRDIEITSQNGTIETGANTTLSLDGQLSGSGRLTKEGGGTLVLAGDNAGGQGAQNTNGSGWTGGLNVNGGLVKVTNSYGLGWGTLSVNGGTINATVDILTGQNINLTGSVSVNVGGGTSTNTNTNPGTNPGTTPTTPPPTSTVGDNLNVSGSGTLVKEGGGVLVVEGTVSNTGGVQVNDGVLTLSGNNSYTGGTSINGGTLKITSDGNLGSATSNITLNGGTLQTAASISSSRDLVITGQNGTIETAGAGTVLNLSGSLSGGGRLTKDGEGILVLGGDNSGGQGAQNSAAWTGGIVINAGEVAVTHAKGLGYGELVLNTGTLNTKVDIVATQNISVGAGAVINTDSSTTMTLAGNAVSAAGGGSGSSCFTKTGMGTLNLAGNAQFDATCVMAGRLLANGSFTSLVTVEQGGILGGSGVINGAVAVKGTLSPGNSPGMLTANSTITMAPGSTYKQDIGGAQQASAATPIGVPGYYSFLHVTGNNQFVIQDNATLAPALKDLYTPGEAGYGTAPFVPSVGQAYRFITADGGIVGRFSHLAQPDGMAADTRMAVFYNAGGSNSIDLVVLPSSYSAWASNSNGNGRAAGAVIDRIVDMNQAGTATATQDQLLLMAASRDAASLGSLVKGLSGEVHAALGAAAAQSGWSAQNTVSKRLAGPDAARENDRGLWIDLGGHRGKWDGDGAASGFSANRTQLTVGAEVLGEGTSRIGFGFTHAKSDVSADLGSGSVAQNSGFVYGQTGWNGFIVEGLASHGKNTTKSSRIDPAAMVPALESRTDGNSSVLGVGLRMPRHFNGANVEPFVRVAVQRLTRDAGVESAGSIASLGLNRLSATGTRVLAGLSGSSAQTDPLAASTYKFSAGLGADGGSLASVKQSTSLAGLPASVSAPDAGRVFLQAGVTGTAQLTRQSYVYIGLSGEVRSGYRDFGGNIGLRASF